jgi:hypothetical protein
MSKQLMAAYEAETGNKCPDNVREYDHWLQGYNEWLEKKIGQNQFPDIGNMVTIDKLSIKEAADLHTSVEELENELEILTARHATVFSHVAQDEQEKLLQSVTLTELGREIQARLNKLYEITGDKIYKP